MHTAPQASPSPARSSQGGKSIPACQALFAQQGTSTSDESSEDEEEASAAERQLPELERHFQEFRLAGSPTYEEGRQAWGAEQDAYIAFLKQDFKRLCPSVATLLAHMATSRTFECPHLVAMKARAEARQQEPPEEPFCTDFGETTSKVLDYKLFSNRYPWSDKTLLEAVHIVVRSISADQLHRAFKAGSSCLRMNRTLTAMRVANPRETSVSSRSELMQLPLDINEWKSAQVAAVLHELLCLALAQAAIVALALAEQCLDAADDIAQHRQKAADACQRKEALVLQLYGPCPAKKKKPAPLASLSQEEADALAADIAEQVRISTEAKKAGRRATKAPVSAWGALHEDFRKECLLAFDNLKDRVHAFPSSSNYAPEDKTRIQTLYTDTAAYLARLYEVVHALDAPTRARFDARAAFYRQPPSTLPLAASPYVASLNMERAFATVLPHLAANTFASPATLFACFQQRVADASAEATASKGPAVRCRTSPAPAAAAPASGSARRPTAPPADAAKRRPARRPTAPPADAAAVPKRRADTPADAAAPAPKRAAPSPPPPDAALHVTPTAHVVGPPEPQAALFHMLIEQQRQVAEMFVQQQKQTAEMHRDGLERLEKRMDVMHVAHTADSARTLEVMQQNAKDREVLLQAVQTMSTAVKEMVASRNNKP